MQYGSCLNAHTNQEETVYKLSVLSLPTPNQSFATTSSHLLTIKFE